MIIVEFPFVTAGNTNFPPEQIPIKEFQNNVLHESVHNLDKSTPDTPPRTTPLRFDFKVTPTPKQGESQTPRQFVQPFSTSQFVQPQPVRPFVSTQQTAEPVRSPLPTQQVPVAVSPPQTGFGPLFDRSPAFNFPSTGFAQQQNAFSGNRVARPSLDLEVPFFNSAPQQQPIASKPTNFFAVRIKTPDSDELSGIHDEEDETPSSPSPVQGTSKRRPSIELEPPVQNDAITTAGQNVFPGFPPSKREDMKQPIVTFMKDEDSGALQANSTLDDRFTQVYILPSGQVPPKGPYAHPDLSQNKVIFTDWNSLLQEKPDQSFPNNNYNEYVNGKIPGDEEKKEEDDKKPSDDLQREFSNNFSKPPNFFSVRIRTPDSDELTGIHDEEEDNPSSPSPVQATPSKNQPPLDLLPPYEVSDQSAPNYSIFPLGPNSPKMTQVVFGNIPSFGSKFNARPALNINNVQVAGQSSFDSDSSDLTPRPALNINNLQLSGQSFSDSRESSDLTSRPALNINNIQLSGQSFLDSDDDSNSTTIIQNPFQHPFYKIRKMNDDQNIIFIPLTDSDFALELRKVPLNRSRIARKVLVRTRPLSGDIRTDEQEKLNKREGSEEQHESFKCGHCHQGYLVDREGCVPCVPLN